MPSFTVSMQPQGSSRALHFITSISKIRLLPTFRKNKQVQPKGPVFPPRPSLPCPPVWVTALSMWCSVLFPWLGPSSYQAAAEWSRPSGARPPGTSLGVLCPCPLPVWSAFAK